MKSLFAAVLLASVALHPNVRAASTSTGNESAYAPAPMPDEDMDAPTPYDDGKGKLAATLYQPKDQFRGDGFFRGSTSQSVIERNLKPAPTLLMKVPLN